jgi:hypothetical protein
MNALSICWHSCTRSNLLTVDFYLILTWPQTHRNIFGCNAKSFNEVVIWLIMAYSNRFLDDRKSDTKHACKYITYFNNFNWKQNNSIIQQFKQHGTNKFTRKEIIFMGHRPSHPRLKWNVLKVLRHLSKIRITSRSTRHIRLFSCNLFIHLLTWLDSLVNVLHPCAVLLLLTLTGLP